MSNQPLQPENKYHYMCHLRRKSKIGVTEWRIVRIYTKHKSPFAAKVAVKQEYPDWTVIGIDGFSFVY